MKLTKQLLAGLLLAALFTSASLVRAADARPHDHAATAVEKKDEKPKSYPLSFCVVSDEKFEGSSMKPVELVYEGQTMKFCCKDCVKDFNKDPKKFAAKFADEVKKLEAAKKK